jgi:multiple sugar transport system ATP-binding protein
MSVAENFTFGLRRQGVARAEIERRLREVSDVLGLQPFLQRRPKNLSGGQQQRVAMARAMIKTPRVFLFDEPLSNLDAKLRERLRTEIRKTHLALKTTTIFVTHDQLEAMTIADRIVLMRAGQIEQQGAPDEIFERPASRFVADFVGSPAMNFCKARIARNGGSVRAVAGALALDLPAQRFSELADGREVELGLPPWRIDRAEDGAVNAMSGAVVLVENFGDRGQVIVDAGGREMSFVTKQFRDLPRGANVRFAIEPQHIHVFDKVTGLSLRQA